MLKTKQRSLSPSVPMTEGSLWKNILIFSLPLMLSQILQVLFNMADVAIVGKFSSSNAMGSVGSTSILVTLFTGFLIGMGAGVNVRVAQLLGAKRQEDTEKAVHTALLLCVLTGVIISGLCIFSAEWMLRLIRTRDDLLEGAELYFRIYALGMPAMGVFNFGNGVMSANGDTRRPLMYLLTAGILNVIMNLFFVIVCNMAEDGVALSSIISQYITAVLILVHMFRDKSACGLRLRSIRFWRGCSVPILVLGIPAGIQNAIFAVANLFIQRSVNYFDTVMELYYMAKRTCSDTQLFVEQRLDMSPWIPGCFGTGDAVIVSDDVLVVCDLKYGKGVPVVAEGNPQARCYGLGAYNAFGAIYAFKSVRNIIIQPRLDSVTEETLPLDELLAWGSSIAPLAEQAWRGEGEFHTGEHCRFCNARAICKARAFESFDVLTHCIDSPDVLPDELVPGLLRVADTAEAWLKDLKAYALAQALRGQEWSGYKVVRGKRPSRAFRNQEEAEQQLIRAGYTPDQYMETRMKTVAEVEKLMGKRAFDAIMSGQVVQGEGNFTLVPDDDKRVAFESADFAFADMGSGQEATGDG